MSTLQDCQEAWEQLKTVKIIELEEWEPQDITVQDLTSIPELIKKMNDSMSKHLDQEPVHRAAHHLTVMVSDLPFEDFQTWNSQEGARAYTLGEAMKQITSEKLLQIMGLR